MKKKTGANRFKYCKAISELQNSQIRREADRINDQEYLSYCIDTYQNLIFSICYKLTGNYFDAEDLTQDTFLSAYRNFSKFDGKNEKAWLARIATNKCLDYKKRGARSEVPTQEEFFAAQPQAQGSDNTCETLCMQKLVLEELKRCCETLKPPYDEIAEKYFYQEMSVGEIASALNRNEKTVQTQVYRAKAMLRKLYEKNRSGKGRDDRWRT